ncbi:UDPglucose 6-dehydrogenase [Nocardiopsis flavescens]|uniref:UDP-glucose 6-dehydrogenase n=1 Tax=Nocardiopsis flavescens TaxID=758803 RepID=A0A1M6M0W5_9ACTN|nr:UDP-glucose/GDP-mannose dehydrogenase family protein [Nocardiopsis flavescens]SHJ77054.1 UDPglucose 6-dehydrogenase [Nocardiopsis flavescens]
MRVSVIGCGHLGAVHAACLAETGSEVIGIDVDRAKVDTLAAGRSPFHEPGLDDLLARNIAAGRLRFTTDHGEAAAFADVHFICVGTPQLDDSGAADLSHVTAALEELGPRLERPVVVIGKSTVPVGTTAALSETLRALAPAGDGVELGWSPEFLREGFGVPDTLRPDRIVLGTDSPRVEEVMREVCVPQILAGVPFLVTDPATAELAKASANAFLATKISFINAVAELAEATGADVHRLAAAIGHDVRIGAAGLRPGIGYGGGCLPKDVRALRTIAAGYGAETLSGLLDAVETTNEARRLWVIEAAEQMCGPLTGVRAAVLGAAFKPGTDDIRDSPALDIASRLQNRGARVTVYDPEAMDNARAVHPELAFAASAAEAVTDAEVVLHLTEWPEFRDADPKQLGKAVRARRLIDGRGGLDHARWETAGWEVAVLGRGPSE